MNTTATQNHTKDELQITLSKFSHEIRNPLALVSSEMQLMTSRHPEIADYSEWYAIMDNIEYIRSLLDELSCYSHAAHITPRPTQLAPYLHSLVNVLKPTMDYLDITLETEIAPDLPNLPLDHLKMRQALFNLLRNAQEAVSYPGGHILLRAQNVGSRVCISVEDNGCGIQPEQIDSIFSLFVTSKPEGTGIGLAITKEIIEAHGGQIEVDCRPGQGTIFRLFLG